MRLVLVDPRIDPLPTEPVRQRSDPIAVRVGIVAVRDEDPYRAIVLGHGVMVPQPRASCTATARPAEDASPSGPIELLRSSPRSGADLYGSDLEAVVQAVATTVR